MQSYGQTGVNAYTPQQQQQMMIQQQALALQQQQRAQQQQTGYGQPKPAMHRPALAPPQPAAVARPPAIVAKPAVERSATAHLNINGMLSDGTLSIKPFSPHMLSVEHNVYFLKLGDTFYRAAPRIPLANPYDPEGPYNGLTEKPRHAVEWSEIREKLVAAETERGGGDRTAAETKIDTVFRPSVIAPTDRAILLNPLETIVAHTDECIAFPEDCLPVVEAASCMSRCLIQVRLTRSHGWGGQVTRPSLTITNLSHSSKCVIIVDRPIATIGFVATPFYDPGNRPAGRGRAQAEAEIQRYRTLWHPLFMIYDPPAELPAETPPPQSPQQQQFAGYYQDAAGVPYPYVQ